MTKSGQVLYDAIIIGGGPAGLNAAVVLGRCRRKVLLFDHGQQRNKRSHGMHNFLTRDDILPTEFIALCHAEIRKYGVEYAFTEITEARKTRDGNFELKDKKGKRYYCRKLILATGLADTLPPMEGVQKYYGRSVFHCPYCDGWENTGKKIGVYAKSKAGIGLAMSMQLWSDDVTLFTDGASYLSKRHKLRLISKKITVVEEEIDALTGNKKFLTAVLLKNGKKIACEGFFFSNGYTTQVNLAGNLGCLIDEKKVAITTRSQKTNIKGVYVAGDAAKDVHFVVVAAAEGAKAGVYVNKELLAEDLVNKKNKPLDT